MHTGNSAGHGGLGLFGASCDMTRPLRQIRHPISLFILKRASQLHAVGWPSHCSFMVVNLGRSDEIDWHPLRFRFVRFCFPVPHHTKENRTSNMFDPMPKTVFVSTNDKDMGINSEDSGGRRTYFPLHLEPLGHATRVGILVLGHGHGCHTFQSGETKFRLNFGSLGPWPTC
ncbi:hypothetical protein BC828DRAFT_390741 [Blastocladiella britannica]|nr:hypothetical protein BC828DRAFT_390741 [Blastocladiella britannica]